jgi:8-oxo-dGTP pyrophosphatase MutT (NUDIX family)
MKGVRLTESTVREPLREHLRTRAPVRLSGGVPCAVLVPLFEKDDEVHVWLCRRNASLRQHSGQVSFPGGKHEPSDESLLMTALRESKEEVGVEPSSVDVLGQLDDYFLRHTGFVVTPYVGWLSHEVALTPNPVEVARVFPVPLRTFLGTPTGAAPFVGYTVDGELVWGATAAMARAFASLVLPLVQGG